MAQKPTVLLVHPPIFDFTAFDIFLYPLGLLDMGARLEAAGIRVACVDALDRWTPITPPPRHLRLRPPTFRNNGTGHFHRQKIAKPPEYAEIPRRFHRFGIPRDALKEGMQNAVESGERPAAVGITCTMTYWYRGVREVVEIARELFGDVPVVLGGIYPTLCPDHARRESGADFVIEGSDARPLFDLLDIDAGPAPVVPGAEQPAPPAEIPPVTRPAHHLLGPRESAALRSSVGCPFHCTYCASRELSGPYRRRPTGEVAAELTFLVENQGCRHVAFHDDALVTKDGVYFLELADAIRRRGLHEKASFHCINGLNASAVTGEIAGALRQSGFTTIRLGFETTDRDLQTRTGFKSSADDLTGALDSLFSAGFGPRQTGVYVMAGLPGQEYASVLDTIRFVHDAGALTRITEFAPVPGTRAFREARSLSRVDLDEPLNQSKCLAAFRFDTLSYGQLREAKEFATGLNMGLLESADNGTA
jgi:hypothetical protein